MKKILLTTLTALILIIPAIAQNENDEVKTLFGNNRSQGGYFALYGGYSEINGIEGVTVGSRAAWVAGHGFAIGVVGNGFMNNFTPIGSEQSNLAGGYGGLLLEPILFPRSPVHLAFPIVLGGGGIAYTLSSEDAYNSDWTSYVEDMDVFLIAEPGAELEFNISRFFRLGLGASYRLTSPVHLETVSATDKVSEDALRGLSFGLSLKFGKF
ncbi:MAG: hypothetical protein U0T82_10475 [Bacteroidales bacterium]